MFASDNHMFANGKKVIRKQDGLREKKLQPIRIAISLDSAGLVQFTAKAEIWLM
jgi:hypothetical protein